MGLDGGWTGYCDECQDKAGASGFVMCVCVCVGGV